MEAGAAPPLQLKGLNLWAATQAELSARTLQDTGPKWMCQRVETTMVGVRHQHHGFGNSSPTARSAGLVPGSSGTDSGFRLVQTSWKKWGTPPRSKVSTGLQLAELSSRHAARPMPGPWIWAGSKDLLPQPAADPVMPLREGCQHSVGALLPESWHPP